MNLSLSAKEKQLLIFVLDNIEEDLLKEKEQDIVEGLLDRLCAAETASPNQRQTHLSGVAAQETTSTKQFTTSKTGGVIHPRGCECPGCLYCYELWGR